MNEGGNPMPSAVMETSPNTTTRVGPVTHYEDTDMPRNGRKRKTLCGRWSQEARDFSGEPTCETCLARQDDIDSLAF